MHSDPTDLLLSAATANLILVARIYRTVADEALAELGLSQATAWPIVMTGRMGEGVRQGALAAALGIEGPSLVRVLDQLVAGGLMTRRECADDRRAKTLHLTADGVALRTQVETLLVQVRRKVFHGIDLADVQAMLRVMDQLKISLGPKAALALQAAPALHERGDSISSSDAAGADLRPRPERQP